MEKTDRENLQAMSSEKAADQAPAEEPQPTEQAQAVEERQPGLSEDIATLRLQVQEKEAEAKTNYDLFLRGQAELENFKRRMQREKAEFLRFANEPLIRDLLPVVDNLERAIAHAQGGGNGQPLVEGVSLVLRSFLETLEKHGVSRLAAKGEPFDPNHHEAMAQVESSAVAPNSVVDEHLPGYLLHERLLRPALVTVAKAPPHESPAEEADKKKSEE